MTSLNTLRQSNKLVAYISRLQNSFLYPAILAVLCAISGVSGKEIYVPCICIMTLLSLLAALFSDDLKVFLVPAIICYYGIGLDVSESYFADLDAPFFDPLSLIPLLSCGVIIVAALIWRLISDGYMKELITKRGIFFWGLLLVGVSLLIGGLFSREWSPLAIAFAILIGVFFLAFYMLFVTILAHSRDGIAYLCKTVICLGFAVSAQILTIAYRLHINDNFFRYDEGVLQINRLMLSTSWGVATIIGATLVPPIIAALYMMRNHRFPFFLSHLPCFSLA